MRQALIKYPRLASNLQSFCQCLLGTGPSFVVAVEGKDSACHCTVHWPHVSTVPPHVSHDQAEKGGPAPFSASQLHGLCVHCGGQ
jgi:hypothetical protein